jgi:DNA-binding NtrC family response regulator
VVVALDGYPCDAREELRSLRKHLQTTPLVCLGRNLDVDAAVGLMRLGAADVVALPASPGHVAQRALSHALGAGEDGSSDPLGGRSPRMCRFKRDLAAVSRQDSTVLLCGETGTGKGLAARVLHDWSHRSQGPFIHVDCAALAVALLESELFGHERGAFTGAVARRKGRFETAGHGTIFLDEIAELAPSLQAKLLRVLEDRSYERVGGSSTLRMGARVIAATNRQLEGEVRTGRFRADLYFRLKVFELELPPLRERLADLPLLARRGLEELASRLGVPLPPTTDCFYRGLMQYRWPGNVRELLHVLEHLLITRTTGDLDELCLGDLLGPTDEAARASPLELDLGDPSVREGPWPPWGEAQRIREALLTCGGNVARAARRLQLPRTTLWYRIQRLGLRSLIPND